MKYSRVSNGLKAVIVLSLALFNSSAFADRFFVMPVVFKGESTSVALQFEEAVRSAVPSDGRNVLVSSVASSQYQIEPRVVEFEREYQVSLDKRQGSTIVYTKSLTLPKDQSIVDAGTWLATQVTSVLPYNQRSEVGSLLSTGAQPPVKKAKLSSRWYFSYGPASGNGLNSSDVLVNLNLGHAWELDKTIVRVYYNSTTGQNQDSNLGLRGFGLSGGQHFSSGSSSPFINADLIYGGASYSFTDTSASIAGSNSEREDSKSGFIYGLGAGMMFCRNQPLAFETALQYNAFMGSTPNGTPTTFGFRVGVHY